MTRVTRWACLIGYVLVASGLPLPIGTTPTGRASQGDRIAAGRLAGKDRSRAFPCMDKPCGCATAEQCFTSCCCHTPAESLAWARAHDVDAAVLASLERRVAASLPQATGCCSSAKSASCCDETSTPKSAAGTSCCSAAAATVAPVAACCATAAHPAIAMPEEPATSPDDHTPVAATLTSVVLRAMLACSGLAAEWFAASGALPPPLVTLPAATTIVASIPLRHWLAVSVPASPDTPPPRVG
jgi:hypothetical protein